MQKISASTSTANAAGEFTEGSSTAGVDSTQIKAAWLNSIQRELLAVIEAAGLTADAATDTQLRDAIRQIIRNGAAHYAADTGVANAYTVAYTPAVTALVDGMVLRFAAKTANTGESTFAADGLAAKPILGLAQAVLQGGEIAVGSRCAVIWSSSKASWILLYASGGAQQVSTASASRHAATAGQIQSGSLTYAPDTSAAANTITASLSPALTSIAIGLEVLVLMANTNTGPVTLNLNALGVKPVTRPDGSALIAGDLLAGQVASMRFDGTRWQYAPSRGRLLSVRVIDGSGTYTKTPGTRTARVRGVGGGGAGGGCAVTSSNQAAAAGGGGAGAYGEALIDLSSVDTVSCTIGAAGTPVTGGSGGNGGSTSFGSYLTLPGGNGGGTGVAVSTMPQQSGGPGALSSAPSGANILGLPGEGGTSGKAYQVGSAEGGYGGRSPLGSWSRTGNSGYGVGGTGASTASSNSAASAGYAGSPGVLIVEEFS